MKFVLKHPNITSYYTYLRHSRYGHKYITKQGKEYKEYIQTEMKRLMELNEWVIIDHKIKLTIVYMFKGNRRRDLDDADKALFDCLNGVLYTDDSLIFERNGYKIMSCNENIIHIEIDKYSIK